MRSKGKSSRWQARIRRKLIVHLGGACAICGTDQELTFDHVCPESRHWVASDYGPYARLLFYALDIAKGEIQVLCSGCNEAKQLDRRRQLEFKLELDPF